MDNKEYIGTNLDKWPKPYFDINIAKLADRNDTTTGGYVVTLCKFGVCGVVERNPNTVTEILKANNISFTLKSNGVIYLTNLEEKVKTALSKEVKRK